MDLEEAKEVKKFVEEFEELDRTAGKDIKEDELCAHELVTLYTFDKMFRRDKLFRVLMAGHMEMYSMAYLKGRDCLREMGNKLEKMAKDLGFT